MIERLRVWAKSLKLEAHAVYLAAKDPRTPWYAKVLVFFVVAHTFSPIDLIPDFIPVLGYLDDLIITPVGLWLVVKVIPPEVLEEARRAAAVKGQEGSVGLVGAGIILFIWVFVAVYLIKIL